MKPDEIIAMAREAGFDVSNLPSIRASNVYGEVNDELELFAALVAAKAAADERAACAQVCDRFDKVSSELGVTFYDLQGHG